MVFPLAFLSQILMALPIKVSINNQKKTKCKRPVRMIGLEFWHEIETSK
jgi:hypothetical protein